MDLRVILKQRSPQYAVYEVELPERVSGEIAVSEFDCLMWRMTERDLAIERALSWAEQFGFERDELDVIYSEEIL